MRVRCRQCASHLFPLENVDTALNTYKSDMQHVTRTSGVKGLESMQDVQYAADLGAPRYTDM